MDPNILTEIDTTPFKTNSTSKLGLSHGVYPKYVPPSAVVDTVSDTTVHNGGHFDSKICNLSVDYTDGLATTLDTSSVVSSASWEFSVAQTWNLSTWNLTQAELELNLTTEKEEVPGWQNSGGWRPQVGQWSPGLLAMTGLALYTLALCTAVGNALVIHAIRTEKRLQTVSNLFIMSLAAADLTVGVIVMPISAAYAMMVAELQTRAVQARLRHFLLSSLCPAQDKLCHQV